MIVAWNIMKTGETLAESNTNCALQLLWWFRPWNIMNTGEKLNDYRSNIGCTAVSIIVTSAVTMRGQ